MNPTLIAKLKALNPTEGDWRYDESMDFPFIETDEWNIDTDGISEDDHKLITLAPAMREELLKMEEERTKEKYLLERAMSALDDYLNAGFKEERREASVNAKKLYEEYYGIKYINKTDRP